MTETNYKELNQHTGHEVEVVNYADQNVAVECVECGVVIQDYEKEDNTLYTQGGLIVKQLESNDLKIQNVDTGNVVFLSLQELNDIQHLAGDDE